MNSILHYLRGMLPFMLSVLGPLILWRLWRSKKIKTKPLHEIGLTLLVLFTVGLASQTVLPKLTQQTPGGWDGINLIPFHILRETYIEVTRYGNVEYFLINFLGNIGIFMPLGFLPPLLWRLRNGQVLLLGFSVSLTIELMQLFLPRSTDVDDLLLNTLGTLLGLLLYRWLEKRFPAFCKKFKN